MTDLFEGKKTEEECGGYMFARFYTLEEDSDNAEAL